MNIVVPISRKYLRSRYMMSDELLTELVNNVLRNLLNRLSMDQRVMNIDLVGDIEDLGLASISAKISTYTCDTSNLTTSDAVISNYFSVTSSSAEVFIIYNPLFPFVGLEKLSFAYELVRNQNCGVAIGGFATSLGVYDKAVTRYVDNGIFSVIRRSTFEQNETKISHPVDVIGLSAIELISLRSIEDMDLFGLVVNSGIIQ